MQTFLKEGKSKLHLSCMILCSPLRLTSILNRRRKTSIDDLVPTLVRLSNLTKWHAHFCFLIEVDRCQPYLVFLHHNYWLQTTLLAPLFDKQCLLVDHNWPFYLGNRCIFYDQPVAFYSQRLTIKPQFQKWHGYHFVSSARSSLRYGSLVQGSCSINQCFDIFTLPNTSLDFHSAKHQPCSRPVQHRAAHTMHVKLTQLANKCN